MVSSNKGNITITTLFWIAAIIPVLLFIVELVSVGFNIIRTKEIIDNTAVISATSISKSNLSKGIIKIEDSNSAMSTTGKTAKQIVDDMFIRNFGLALDSGGGYRLGSNTYFSEAPELVNYIVYNGNINTPYTLPIILYERVNGVYQPVSRELHLRNPSVILQVKFKLKGMFFIKNTEYYTLAIGQVSVRNRG